MSYCMYLRKSRADMELETKGSVDTLDRHRTILLELAKKHGVIIVKEYQEVVSGETITSRPAMQALLSDVEQGKWQGVYVVEIERLARGDTVDQGIVAQTFKYSNTKIVTPSKTFDPNNEFDEEYFEFGLFMSRREYKTINRRLEQGKLASVKEGKYVGGTPPYGYERVKIKGQKGHTLKILPEEAKIVRFIFNSYSTMGINAIASQLSNMQVPSPNSLKEWNATTISNILKSHVYMGKIRYKYHTKARQVVDGEVVRKVLKNTKENVLLVDGLHEAIIEEDLFYEVQEKLKVAVVPTSREIQNPFSGILICGLCGRRMQRNTYGNLKPSRIQCPSKLCPNVSVQLHIVEEKLIATMEEWLKNYEVESVENTNNSLNELEIVKSSITSLDKELSVLQKQMDKLYDLVEQGVYTAQVFLERSEKIKKRMDEITGHTESLLEKVGSLESLDKRMNEYIPKTMKIIEIYKEAQSGAEKNELLKSVLERVEYVKTSSDGRQTGIIDDFSLKFYPKFPSGNM